MLGQQIECPGCGSTLKTRLSKSRRSSSDADAQRRRKSSKKSRPSASESSSRRRPSRKSSSKASNKRQTGQQKRPTKKQRSKPAAVEDDLLDDGWSDFDDDFVASDNLFADEDAWDDDSNGEDWLDESPANDWDSPATLPSTPGSQAKTKKKTSKNKASSKKKKRSSGGRPVVCVGAGLLAGLGSVAISIGVGFTGIWFLILLSTILSGSMIGGAVRLTAGKTGGWAPGLVALAIAIPAIALGRIGAFYVSPEMAELTDTIDQSPAEIQEQIDRDVAEDGMIKDLIEDQLLYDAQWQTASGVNEDHFYSDAWNDGEWEEGAPYSEWYNETVWEEGRKRWNVMSAERRAQQSESRRLHLLMENGMMDDQSFATLLDLSTSDAGMTERQVRTVEQNTVAERPQDGYIPDVWDEASRRWSEMSEEEQSAEKSTVEVELQQQFEGYGALEGMKVGFKFGVVIVGGLISLFVPFGPIICTFSAMFSAFKLGSGMATG